jgi:prevent-host-death family protein
VAETSIRDLRNHGGDVVDRVTRGERITITRGGKPVAELRPLPRKGMSATAFIERFKRLPPIDSEKFRHDVDGAVDQTL